MGVGSGLQGPSSAPGRLYWSHAAVKCAECGSVLSDLLEKTSCGSNQLCSKTYRKYIIIKGRGFYLFPNFLREFRIAGQFVHFI